MEIASFQRALDPGEGTSSNDLIKDGASIDRLQFAYALETVLD